MPNTIIIPAADIGDVADAGTFDLSNAIASSASTVTGLTNGTSYRAFVLSAASDAFAPSASSSAPAEVTGLGVTPGDGQNALAWTAPADGGSAITDYVIEVSTNGGSSWATVSDGTSTTASHTHTGLTNGTTYTYRVSAVNAIGTGPASAIASGTPEAATASRIARFDHASDPGSATTYTFSAMDVAAGSVIVAAFGRPYSDITAVTVGGVGATEIGDSASLGQAHQISMWIAEGVSGSTADVVVTFSGSGGSPARCGVSVWSVSGDPAAADCTYAAAADDAGGTAITDTIDVVDGGVLLAHVSFNDNNPITGSFTAGIDQTRFLEEISGEEIWHAAGDADIGADGSGRTVTFTPNESITFRYIQLVHIAPAT